MATPNYTEEEILFRRRARRRLVGAVVLVVTVIAVVPMILPENKPQQDTQQIEIRIPVQDATGYAPKITAAPSAASAVTPVTASNIAPLIEPSNKDELKPATNVPPVPAIAPPAQPDKPQAATAATEKPVAAKLATEPAKAMPGATSKPSAAASKQTYFVQYGAFSEQKNAKQRQTELKAKGVNTFTEVVKTSAGDKIRVRSGPYAVREEAEKVRVKVKPLDTKLVVLGSNP